MHWLKEFRIKKGLTQIQFSKRLKVSQALVSKVESGKFEASASLFSALRREFKFNVNSLLDRLYK